MNNRRWVDVAADEVRETEKAILLDFGHGHELWIPKSQYRLSVIDNFQVQQISAWFLSANSLWHVVR